MNNILLKNEFLADTAGEAYDNGCNSFVIAKRFRVAGIILVLRYLQKVKIDIDIFL